MAFLKQAGFEPGALDLSVEHLDLEKASRARFVGISVPMHTALRLGVQAARRVRAAHPSCHICFFGLYASLNADYLLSEVADSVIGGESEEALVSLVQALEAGTPHQAQGVSLRGRLQGPLIQRIAFTLPERQSLPGLGRYAQLELNGERRLAGAVEASRGCKHRCLHCPIPPIYGGRFFIVPKETVLEDVRGLVRSGARHMTFGDPDFLNGPGHSLAIVRAMHEEFPELTFDFTAKIEHLLKDTRLVPELARLGCLFVISAVESLSNVVLSKLRKGHTRRDVLAALDMLRDAGIALRPSWVAFTPWTTLEDYWDMLGFIEKEGLVDHVDPVQLSIRLLVPPGSSLLTGSDIMRYVQGFDQPNFYYRWSHPDRRMDDLHEAVSRVVAEAAARREDADVTFEAVRLLALRALGRQEGRTVPRMSADRRKPPRLTESWFCCAEPTREQFAPLAVETS
jgi:radical SAM superfamily enzyme YgiQ (UPF0313 family)